MTLGFGAFVDPQDLLVAKGRDQAEVLASAEEALRWGMVQEVTEPGHQIDRARELAESVARVAPLAVQGLLRASRHSLEHGREDCARQIFQDLAPVMASEDAAEGVQSFLERREAVFRGR